MEDKLQELRNRLHSDFENVKNLDDLKDLKVKYLGKKGALTEVLRSPWLCGC